MNELVTKQDLRDAVASIRESQAEFRQEVRIAFQDVKQRQDRTNGRIDAGEERHFELARLVADLAQTLAGVVATLKALAAPVTPPALAQPKAADDKPGITQRDIKVASVMLGVGAVIIEYGPKVLKAVAAIGGTP